MEQYVIKGGNPLVGEVEIGGGIKTGQIQIGQTCTVAEHITHVCHVGGIETGQI